VDGSNWEHRRPGERPRTGGDTENHPPGRATGDCRCAPGHGPTARRTPCASEICARHTRVPHPTTLDSSSNRALSGGSPRKAPAATEGGHFRSPGHARAQPNERSRVSKSLPGQDKDRLEISHTLKSKHSEPAIRAAGSGASSTERAPRRLGTIVTVPFWRPSSIGPFGERVG